MRRERVAPIRSFACSAAFIALAFAGSGCDTRGRAPQGMVWIPGGSFTMGGQDDWATEAEKPAHPVQVDGFFMDTHTVTNAQFRAFVEATGYVTLAERAPTVEDIRRALPPDSPPPDPKLLVPGSVVFTPTQERVDLADWSQGGRWVPGASWRGPVGPGTDIEGKDNFPVVHVAWVDAVEYLKWAGKRLPRKRSGNSRPAVAAPMSGMRGEMSRPMRRIRARGSTR